LPAKPITAGTADLPNLSRRTGRCPRLYAWYVDASDGDGGIWQTFDGGTNWKKLVDAGITNCGDAFGGCGTSQGSYNLELAAVPNGDATDLYAGAINLYKCTISSIFPSCDPNFVPTPPPDATFQNLTHVYGCPPDFGAIAHVHPDQHGITFMQVSDSQVVIYFANDGGIYRALDGYSGLTTGSCSGHNQFESLNQTLGSMTQFVSFSQHPTDPGTILGGSQDNGSPATNMGPESSTQWLNVNSGDGGYNAINPANPTEWFTANTDVSIQRCTWELPVTRRTSRKWSATPPWVEILAPFTRPISWIRKIQAS
jgi:hypothetical protein